MHGGQLWLAWFGGDIPLDAMVHIPGLGDTELALPNLPEIQCGSGFGADYA